MINSKVVMLSILALFFIVLSFLVDWLFLIPAVIIFFVNQKELKKKR